MVICKAHTEDCPASQFGMCSVLGEWEAYRFGVTVQDNLGGNRIIILTTPTAFGSGALFRQESS